MVQYIPGPEQLLAPAAQQITEGVLNFINPNRQFQQAVQAQLAQNPEIAQHFANLEASSPGLLQSLGIGRLASIPPSPEKEFELKNREAIVKGREAQLGAQTAGAVYTQQDIQNALQYVSENPNIRIDQALQRLTGQTTSERLIKQEEATQAPLKTAAMKSGLPVQQAEDQFRLESFNAANDLLQNGPEVSMQRFLAPPDKGGYTNRQILGITSSPFWPAIKAQLDFQNDRYRIALMSGRQDDAMERLREANAFKLFTELADPNITLEGVKRVIGRGPGEVIDPADTEGKAIEAGISRLNNKQKEDLLSDLNKNLTATLIRIQSSQSSKDTQGEKGDAFRALTTQELNDLLARKARIMGTKPFTVSWGPATVVRSKPGEPYKEGPRNRIFSNPKDLVFRDPEGRIVSGEQALLNTPSPSTTPTPPPASKDTSSTTSKTGKEALGPLPPTMLNAMVADYNRASAGEKAAMLARWRTEAPADAIRQIEAAIGVKK